MISKRATIICIFNLSTCFLSVSAQEQKVWSLQDCIDHALTHNIQIKKDLLSNETAIISVKAAKSALYPTLSADVTQGITFRPFQKEAGSYINGSIASSSSNKMSQSGSYGINAKWTVWDGGQSRQYIKSSQMNQQITELSSSVTANSIQEQLAQIYIQILYTQKALKVNETLQKHDIELYERGKSLMQCGKMSTADVAQLEAQVEGGKYDIVNTLSQISSYKLQLKQLLELGIDEDIQIDTLSNIPKIALSNIPNKIVVYNAALMNRPEIKSGKIAIEQSNLAIKMAKAAYSPTISMTAGVGDSHMTGIQNDFGTQMRNNFNGAVGISVSIPILDNRTRKSNLEKAKVNQLSSKLDLQDYQKKLYYSIENYWINAVNSSEKFKASNSNVKSLNTSYKLVDEQFKVGNKNIAELLTSRAKLLTAEQDKLQNEYTALLNITLLKFYLGEKLEF